MNSLSEGIHVKVKNNSQVNENRRKLVRELAGQEVVISDPKLTAKIGLTTVLVKSTVNGNNNEAQRISIDLLDLSDEHLKIIRDSQTILE